MRRNIEDKLNDLNTSMIDMGAQCEQIIACVEKALSEHDSEAIAMAQDLQQEIQQKGAHIEELCLHILLLQQPVADDMRAVTAALKMVTDMSRIGEICADMSEEIGYLGEDGGPASLHEMADTTSGMVTRAIDAYVQKDYDGAESVIQEDDTVDELFLQTRDRLIESIRSRSKGDDKAVDLIMIAKYFEKIGDHAVNIASWVQFSLAGNRKD